MATPQRDAFFLDMIYRGADSRVLNDSGAVNGACLT